MKRWNGKDFSENEKVDNFLNEIKGVCKKHGFSIAPEDSNGDLEIEAYSDENIEWLFKASDRT